ncbi:MAG: hypothetical protein OXP71_13350 [Candidatus Poribacteria bacterium]|nr:hypothetical protein [Candidatus Poribacteria bacterium]
MIKTKIFAVLLIAWISVSFLGCGDSEDGPVNPVEPDVELELMYDDPAQAGRPVPSFSNDILPILTQRCALSGCHVAGGPHGVDLRTYESVQKGGEHGAIVVAGNAAESEMVEEIVEGNMPLGGPRLKTAQIQLIIDWVNSGANND